MVSYENIEAFFFCELTLSSIGSGIMNSSLAPRLARVSTRSFPLCPFYFGFFCTVLKIHRLDSSAFNPAIDNKFTLVMKRLPLHCHVSMSKFLPKITSKAFKESSCGGKEEMSRALRKNSVISNSSST